MTYLMANHGSFANRLRLPLFLFGIKYNHIYIRNPFLSPIHSQYELLNYNCGGGLIQPAGAGITTSAAWRHDMASYWSTTPSASRRERLSLR